MFSDENESYSDDGSFLTSDSESLIETNIKTPIKQDDTSKERCLLFTEPNLDLNCYKKLVIIKPNQKRSQSLDNYFNFNRSIVHLNKPILISESRLISECIM
jgi:hypothetical protein